jgi:hypothetical protein
VVHDTTSPCQTLTRPNPDSGGQGRATTLPYTSTEAPSWLPWRPLSRSKKDLCLFAWTDPIKALSQQSCNPFRLRCPSLVSHSHGYTNPSCPLLVLFTLGVIRPV